MKIRTPAGEVIDLAKVREEHRTCTDSEIIENLLDALEAALSVPPRDAVSWEDACEIGYGNADDGVSEGESIGWNNHAAAVRQAAGVVDE